MKFLLSDDIISSVFLLIIHVVEIFVIWGGLRSITDQIAFGQEPAAYTGEDTKTNGPKETSHDALVGRCIQYIDVLSYFCINLWVYSKL